MPNGINIPITSPPVRTLFDVLNQKRMQQSVLGLQTARTAELMQQLGSGIPLRFAPGAAGLVQGEKMIEDQYGEDSPEAAKAKMWNDINAHEKQARSDYFESNLKFKNLTPLQKEQLATQIQNQTGASMKDINGFLSGISPTTEPMTTQPQEAVSGSDNPNTTANPGSQANVVQNTYTPGEKEKNEADKQVDQTQAQMAKQIGNEAAQKQFGPLLDMAKTINAIDFSPVAKFAGTHGKLNAMYERAKTATGIGEPSEDFKAYDNFVQSQGKLLADSARQALATSVRSQYVKTMLMPLVKTATWYENPELAMNRFNFFRNWINQRVKVMHYLATKGISPNLDEVNKALDVGSPPQQKMVGAQPQAGEVAPADQDYTKMSPEQLRELRRKLIAGE